MNIEQRRKLIEEIADLIDYGRQINPVVVAAAIIARLEAVLSTLEKED